MSTGTVTKFFSHLIKIGKMVVGIISYIMEWFDDSSFLTNALSWRQRLFFRSCNDFEFHFPASLNVPATSELN